MVGYAGRRVDRYFNGLLGARKTHGEHRQDGETEDQFKERVCREVPRARDCVPVLLSDAPD